MDLLEEIRAHGPKKTQAATAAREARGASVGFADAGALRLRFGDAGAVAVRLKGKTLPELGPKGQV